MDTSKRAPMCQCFSSKEMHHEPYDAEENEYASGIYMCSRTYESFGPDGESVTRGDCCPGRSCYQA